jgi:hypothetical protein
VLSHPSVARFSRECKEGNDMAKPSSEPQPGARPSSESTFSDLKRAIAERNEQAHKEARELRAARERKQFGIVARHRLDLDR